MKRIKSLAYCYIRWNINQVKRDRKIKTILFVETFFQRKIYFVHVRWFGAKSNAKCV